jgi:hypothetical protein
MIVFVCYYIHFSKNQIDNINKVWEQVSYNKYVPMTEIELLLSGMFESVRNFHSDAKMVLVTDPDVHLELPSFIDVIHRQRETDDFQIERIKTKIYCLEKFGDDAHVIFLDPDILIRGSLEEIFQRKGDLFFTYETMKSMMAKMTYQEIQDIEKKFKATVMFPINAGFIVVRQGKVHETCRYFRKMIKGFSLITQKEFYDWSGFQYLLRNSIFPIVSDKEDRINTLLLKYYDLKIALLNADIYNYAPEPQKKIPDNVKIAHFKGVCRKKIMLEYLSHNKTNREID